MWKDGILVIDNEAFRDVVWKAGTLVWSVDRERDGTCIYPVFLAESLTGKIFMWRYRVVVRKLEYYLHDG